MRDTWYADQRDLVKWGTLVHLAQRHSLGAIVQVPYLRQGERAPLLTDRGDVEIHPEVWTFFRTVTAVTALGDRLKKRIVVVDAPFDPRRRAEYRATFTNAVRSIPEPKVVLLDPDTGMARKPGAKHVGTDDIREAWDALRPADWLVVYQHASRKTGWQDAAREGFIRSCGTSDARIFSAPRIAWDVVFLAASKPPASKP